MSDPKREKGRLSGELDHRGEAGLCPGEEEQMYQCPETWWHRAHLERQ